MIGKETVSYYSFWRSGNFQIHDLTYRALEVNIFAEKIRIFYYHTIFRN